MHGNIICSKCGLNIGYDSESTMYLKCPCCDTVLVESNNYNGTLTVIDYGITNIDNKDWMYVKTEDINGRQQTYWKQK